MAEGTMCDVKGIGDVGKLKDVLHVEGLVFDLVSESWCDKQGMQGHWGAVFVTLKTLTGLYSTHRT